MPKVSVVIPCYNHASYLRECVESVLAQTYRDFEIIIVNDGSPDDTKEVAEAVIGEFPDHRIRLISQQNTGLPGARNSGISIAVGEYILPLDADDLIAPDCLLELCHILDGDGSVAMTYSDTLIREDGEGQDAFVIPAREYDLKNLLKDNRHTACALFRRDAWERVGGYKKDMVYGYEDWEFWITLGEAGFTGRPVRKPLFIYRKHGESMLGGSKKKDVMIRHQIRGFHLALYYPILYRTTPILAVMANWLQFRLRDPIAFFIYRTCPGAHSFIRKNILFRS